MANKYQYYSVKVKYINGNTEEIEYLNEEPVEKSSYKTMLQVYNETKKLYEGDCVTIEFLGVTEDQKFNVLWDKELKNDDYENQKPIELIENMSNIAYELLKRQQVTCDKQGLADKEVSVLQHEIESERLLAYSETQQLKLLYDLRKTLLHRRQIKNEVKMYKNIANDVTQIQRLVARVGNRLDSMVDGFIKKTENKACENHEGNLQVIK